MNILSIRSILLPVFSFPPLPGQVCGKTKSRNCSLTLRSMLAIKKKSREKLGLVSTASPSPDTNGKLLTVSTGQDTSKGGKSGRWRWQECGQAFLVTAKGAREWQWPGCRGAPGGKPELGRSKHLGGPPPIKIDPVDKNGGHGDSNLCTGRDPVDRREDPAPKRPEPGWPRTGERRCFQTAWWSGNLKKKLSWGKKGIVTISAPSTLSGQFLHRQT